MVLTLMPGTQRRQDVISVTGKKNVCRSIFFSIGEEDRRWRVWRDLRGAGSADTGQRGPEGGVGAAAQTSAQDGGGRAEEAPG